MLKNIKIATRASILITGILLIGFFGLWKVVDQKSSVLVEEQIINQMTDAVETRAYIIGNYVQSAEEYMIAFAQSDEVRNALLHPDTKSFQERAQQYTVDFAKVKGNEEVVTVEVEQLIENEDIIEEENKGKVIAVEYIDDKIVTSEQAQVIREQAQTVETNEVS